MLELADGFRRDGAALARALRTTLVTVLLWRKRFSQGGTQALLELAPGRGPRRRISRRKIRQIVEATRKAPPVGRKRWSVRSMARAQGVSQGTVQRIWDEYGLKPHLAKRARPAQAFPRRQGMAGLYLNPPDRVLGLVLDHLPAPPARKQPAVPALNTENAPTGLTSLLEALAELESRVVGDSRWRPRQQAFFGFLRRLERVLPGSVIHLVVDREGTHTQDYAQAWLERRPHFHPHPPPQGSTWLNWVGHWLREVSRKRAPRESLPVEQAIRNYLADNPPQPQPFAWPGAQKKEALHGR